VEVTLESNVIEARGILPPGMPGYDAELEGISYDPDRALELLAASTYGDAEGLPEITMVVSGRGGYVSPVVEAFVSQIRENLGIDITIEVLEPEDYYAATEGEHTVQIFSSGWIADYPDPENFLDLLFHSESDANEARYSNPEVDDLLEEARTEADSERREELYNQVERLIVEDAPWLPLYHSVSRYLVQPYVVGLTYTPQGIADLSIVSLEEH
jgi:oligopeptide transport system substrate-binding protein